MEVLPLGFLLLVSMTLVLANAWAVIDAKLAVTAAAREAVRAYVEADSQSQATAAARRRAAETMNAHGRGGSRAAVGWPVLNGQFRRCGRVTVTVSYTLPVVYVPFAGSLGQFRPVTSSFTGVIDPFRSGPPVGRRDVRC